MAKPLSSEEALEKLESAFPEFVINAINEVIKKNFRGKGSFTVKQDEIVEEIQKQSPKALKRDVIFDNDWLDFEKLYERYGWNITYDKPGYNETYDATFEFTPKRKKQLLKD